MDNCIKTKDGIRFRKRFPSQSDEAAVAISNNTVDDDEIENDPEMIKDDPEMIKDDQTSPSSSGDWSDNIDKSSKTLVAATTVAPNLAHHIETIKTINEDRNNKKTVNESMINKKNVNEWFRELFNSNHHNHRRHQQHRTRNYHRQSFSEGKEVLDEYRNGPLPIFDRRTPPLILAAYLSRAKKRH